MINYLYRLSLVIVLFTATTLYAQKPVADFSVDVRDGCGYVIARFTDLSTNNPTSNLWLLGDGNTIPDKSNLIYAYSQVGTFTVTLISKNASGSDTITKQALIRVHPNPVAKFSVNPANGCEPLDVNYINSSVLGDTTIKTWLWDFGDGSTSNTSTPTHRYQNPGTYKVSLEITDEFGCMSMDTGKKVTVNPLPSASFTSSAHQACLPPILVDFSNTSTGTGLSYAWNFGNGQTATTASPSINYNATGNFDVSLVVTDANGCKDTVTQSGFVQVNTFTADFSISTDEACAPSGINFTDKSTGATAWAWSLSDGYNTTQQHFSHTFSLPGVYDATLIATNAIGCKDTITKTNLVTMHGQPTVQFNSSNRIGCEVPFTTTFTDNTINAVSRIWSLGDGTTDTAKTLSHTYTALNYYDVRLIVTDIHGCKDTLNRNNYIRIAGPVAYFTSDGRAGCSPRTVHLQDSSYSTTPIKTYEWLVDNTLTSTDKDPFFTFTDTGKYDVRLIVTDTLGCVDTTFHQQYIQVGMKPFVDFEPDTTEGCYPFTVRFNNILSNDPAIPNPNRLFWRFGDDQVGAGFNPSHLYADTGYFDVTLIAYNNGCRDSLVKDSLIYVHPPVPAFNSSIIGCDTAFMPTFVNSSIGGNKFIWSFGDGSADTTTYTIAAFPHTYANSGLFLTQLIAIDTITQCQDSVLGRVHISKRTIDFVQDTSQRNCLYDNIIYLDLSTANNPIVFHHWAFGDGDLDTSSLFSISHAYDSAGVYDITMIITDSLNCRDTITKSNDIEIHDLPSPRFYISDTSGCAPFTISMVNSSVAVAPTKLISWNWNFGDGTTDTAWAPDHTFTTPNVARTITLHVVDSLQCDSSKSITVLPTFPIVSFTLTTSRPNSGDSLICYTDSAVFTNNTTGIGLHYAWDFGDASPIVTTRNTGHKYITDSTEFFNVTLTVTDTNNCISSYTKRITISHPLALFNADRTKVDCPFPPPVISFIDSSSGDVNQWAWNFGESAGTNSTLRNPKNQYDIAGTYDVSLFVQNKYACNNTLLMPDFLEILGPYATFTYTPIIGCAPLTVNFTAANAKRVGIYHWLYQDGESDSTTTGSATHVYTNEGRPMPMLELIDSINTSCSVPIPSTTPIQVIKGEADFVLNSDDSTCTFGAISFMDASVYSPTHPITSRIWYFGDGDSSTAMNPTHFYDSVGVYDVTLKIMIDSCDYTITKNNLLYIYNPPSLDFTWTDSAGCDPLLVKFALEDSLLKNEIDSVTWHFGDNSDPDTAYAPMHAFNTTQTYTVDLDVTFKNQCKHTYTKQASMLVYPLPVADFTVGNDSLFASEMVQFLDQSQGTELRWFWDFGDSIKSTLQHPYHIFGSTGTFDVMLTVVATGNCSDTITKSYEITEGLIFTNVFTPNGDGINDEFRIPVSGYTNYHITIFNRWGEILFDSNVKNAPWNGRTPGGLPVPSGTYYYILQAESANGEKIDKKDFITLIRE